MDIALRFGARTDVGLVRADNQDSGYAGPDLLAVADGMGGHAGGDIASAIAVAALTPLDGHAHRPDEALVELEAAVENARLAIIDLSARRPELAGMGTTVTAILRADDTLVMAHLGDSRAYLLRDDELTQVTTDHTFVQHLVDTGRISPQEAEHHPQRNVVMRVLGDFEVDLTPDFSVREARPGDRWLLCSDGLSGFVAPDIIGQMLISVPDPGDCAQTLVQLALRSGSSDNVTCVVADVVDLEEDAPQPVEVVGSAALHPVVLGPDGAVVDPRDAAGTAALATGEGGTDGTDIGPGADGDGHDGKGHDGDTSGAGAEGDGHDDDTDEDGREGADGTPVRPRRVLAASLGLAVLLVLLGGGWAAYAWSQDQYYVGVQDGKVAIFQGVPLSLGPVHLSSAVEVTGTSVDSLPPYVAQRLQGTIRAESLADAQVRAATLGDTTPSPDATTSPTATPTPGPGATSGPGTTPGATPGTAVTPAPGTTVAPGTTPAPRTTSTPGPGHTRQADAEGDR